MKWPVGGLRVELRPATSDRVRSEDDALAAARNKTHEHLYFVIEK